VRCSGSSNIDDATFPRKKSDMDCGNLRFLISSKKKETRRLKTVAGRAILSDVGERANEFQIPVGARGNRLVKRNRIAFGGTARRKRETLFHSGELPTKGGAVAFGGSVRPET